MWMWNEQSFWTTADVPGVDGSLKKKYKVRYVDVVKCKKFSTSFKVSGVEHQFMCLLLMAVSRKRLWSKICGCEMSIYNIYVLTNILGMDVIGYI